MKNGSDHRLRYCKGVTVQTDAIITITITITTTTTTIIIIIIIIFIRS